MNATLLYRIAAGLFILFAIGHTSGFLSFRPSTGEGLAVLEIESVLQLPADPSVTENGIGDSVYQ
jgi:hypothetical protein